MNDQKTFSLSRELANARFGDKRLDARLTKLVDCAARRPGKSFPGISNSVAELEATYRFLSNPKVTPDRILSGHIKATVSRASESDRPVIAHDTTDFIFGGQERREGLGWVTNDNQGFRGHFALALSRTAFVHPLGVLGFETLFRTGKARSTSKDKVNFLRMSKGSTFECAAIVDLALDFQLLEPEEYENYQSKLANVGRMLSAMIRYWEKTPTSKEGPSRNRSY